MTEREISKTTKTNKLRERQKRTNKETGIMNKTVNEI
jgi:hypothetical protein